MSKLSSKIDTLIAKLQVYGYKIRINNHNIGDIHNIYIDRYIPRNIMFLPNAFQLKRINHYTYRLPSEGKYLLKKLTELLEEADK